MAANVQGIFYFYLHGSGAGLSNVPTVFTGVLPGVEGHSVAIGDFNGDRFDDFVCGGPFSGFTAGWAFEFAGTSGGLAPFLTHHLRQDFMISDAEDGGNEDDDRFADTLLAADLNNDGYRGPGDRHAGRGRRRGGERLVRRRRRDLRPARLRQRTRSRRRALLDRRLVGMTTTVADGDSRGLPRRSRSGELIASWMTHGHAAGGTILRPVGFRSNGASRASGITIRPAMPPGAEAILDPDFTFGSACWLSRCDLYEDVAIAAPDETTARARLAVTGCELASSGRFRGRNVPCGSAVRP